MGIFSKTTASFSAVVLMIFASSANSGTQAIFQANENGGGKSEVVISVDQGFLAMTHTGKDTSKVIFNSKTEEIIIVNEAEKSFSRIDKETRVNINNKISQVKAQMLAQLEAMPAQQREMMKQMMAQSPMGSIFKEEKTRKIDFKKTEKEMKVAGYSCSVTEKYVEAAKQVEFCSTPSQKIDGSEEILAVMKKLMAIFEEFSAGLPINVGDNPLLDMQEIDGFPVKLTHFKNGTIETVMTLQSIGPQKIDSSFFIAPKNYREDQLAPMAM